MTVTGPFARLRRGGDDAAEPEAATEVVPAVDPAAAAPPAEAPTADETPAEAEADATPPAPFVARGQVRRRLRYLRRAREVALRDLGGLVFELHRFGRDRGELVDQKLAALSALDTELRALEVELDDRRDLTVLREPGLGTCPSCGALHSSDARYCSSCGLPVGAHAARPAGPTVSGPADPLPDPLAPAAEEPSPTSP
jgi:hypothetical protein